MESVVPLRQLKGTDDGGHRVLGDISEKPEGKERRRWTWILCWVIGKHYKGMKHCNILQAALWIEQVWGKSVWGVRNKFLPPAPKFSLMSGGPKKIAMGTGNNFALAE